METKQICSIFRRPHELIQTTRLGDVGVGGHESIPSDLVLLDRTLSALNCKYSSFNSVFQYHHIISHTSSEFLGVVLIELCDWVRFQTLFSVENYHDFAT